jgi:D-alanyl-D-alanine carboxypeptidase
VKAAELLEGGFTQNPLSWLTPALGSVDKLEPINADPPNLHDEVCGRHRKRLAAEDEEDESGGESGGVDTPFSALLSGLRAPTPKGAALLSDFGAVTPTVVYTGPTRAQPELATAKPDRANAHTRGKGAALAAIGSTPWTPLSASVLAASPPSELATGSPADVPLPRRRPQTAP